MGDDVFTYPQLAQNLKAKLENPDFLRDIETLVTKIPDDGVSPSLPLGHSGRLAKSHIGDAACRTVGVWTHRACPAYAALLNGAG
jgi:hypothetical protein